MEQLLNDKLTLFHSYGCIIALCWLLVLRDQLEILEAAEVLHRVSWENHPCDQTFYFVGLWCAVALEEVDLTVSPQKLPEGIEMHFLQNGLISSIYCKFCIPLGFEVIGGAWVIDIMCKCCDEDVEPLLLRETLLYLFWAVICLK
jgi:hypothetical protein